MQFFTEEYTQFFQELEKNNNKDWFHENKKRYETHVKKPMQQLVQELIVEMKMHDAGINDDPKKCIGRINRDIRFAKDKTPYNAHLFAHITKGTKEDLMPGIAFRFGGNDCGIMTGFYTPSKERINAIRNNIASNVAEFQKLLADPKLVKIFGTIRGEANKRIPAEWKETFEVEPLIANKQFYLVSEKAPSFVTSKNLVKEIIEHWMVARDMNDFLSRG